jgi:ADP-heptose:LPS heptosyltransferase
MSESGILCIRLKCIGDVVFTLPAINRLRRLHPDAHITFLASNECAAVLSGFEAVDEVIVLNRAMYRSLNPIRIARATLSLLNKTVRPRFSLVVDFQGYGETALLTRLSGAPQRWGVVYNRLRGLAYTKGVARDYTVHPVDFNLTLLGQEKSTPVVDENKFELPVAELKKASELFHSYGYKPGRPALFIQPFTSAPHKNWPLDSYLALATQLRENNVQVIFGGGPSERAALEPARQLGFPVAAGVPLLVSAGLMHLSSLVLGGDTGLLHLSVSMRKRVLMLIGSTDSGSAVPYGHRDWCLIPRPGQSISQIPVEETLQAARQALAGSEVHP